MNYRCAIRKVKKLFQFVPFDDQQATVVAGTLALGRFPGILP
jgi:hypothetical protein